MFHIERIEDDDEESVGTILKLSTDQSGATPDLSEADWYFTNNIARFSNCCFFTCFFQWQHSELSTYQSVPQHICQRRTGSLQTISFELSLEIHIHTVDLAEATGIS